MNLLAPVALWGFWILLIAGVLLSELRWRGVTVFLILWGLGAAVSRFVFPALPFVSLVAVLDIALVLIVFKGDIKLH
jgi:hypothetical protein